MLKQNIINNLGKKFGFTSYLEISSIITGHVYNKIDDNIFTTKSAIYYIPEGVDPKICNRKDISVQQNKYEYHHNRISDENIKYDIVFVDPWHTYEQSLLDMETALKFVSPNGIIVIHDCCPYDKSLIGPYKKGAWCGQTYESFIDFRYAHKDIEIFCINADYGCGVASMVPRFNIIGSFDDYDKSKITDWDYFNNNKIQLVNLIESEDFAKICDRL